MSKGGNQRRRHLLALGGDARSRLLRGLALLGFTAVYREGFEVVLFLQALRLQAGTAALSYDGAARVVCFMPAAREAQRT